MSSSNHNNFRNALGLILNLVDAIEVTVNLVNHFNDLVGVLSSDLVGNVVVRLLSLGCRIHKVAETQVIELVLEVW